MSDEKVYDDKPSELYEPFDGLVNVAAKKTKYERKLSDAECEVLISEVQSRPCLWNDRHSDFKNTAITRKLWNEIGASIHLTGEETKKKWKNMKDKFRKVVQKPDRKSGSAARAPTHKWKFYDIMQFTKDVVLPSRMVGNLKPQLDEDADEGSIVDVHLEEQVDVQTEPSLQATTTSSSTTFQSGIDKRYARRPHRLKSSAVAKQELEKKSLHHGVKELNAFLSMQKKKEESDDYHFLMSLLPYIQSLDPLEKLEVRSQIQNTVLEAYRNYEAQNIPHVYSHPPSHNSDSSNSNYPLK